MLYILGRLGTIIEKFQYTDVHIRKIFTIFEVNVRQSRSIEFGTRPNTSTNGKQVSFSIRKSKQGSVESRRRSEFVLPGYFRAT